MFWDSQLGTHALLLSSVGQQLVEIPETKHETPQRLLLRRRRSRISTSFGSHSSELAKCGLMDDTIVPGNHQIRIVHDVCATQQNHSTKRSTRLHTECDAVFLGCNSRYFLSHHCKLTNLNRDYCVDIVQNK